MIGYAASDAEGLNLNPPDDENCEINMIGPVKNNFEEENDK